jgi:hypothetical protein
VLKNGQSFLDIMGHEKMDLVFDLVPTKINFYTFAGAVGGNLEVLAEDIVEIFIMYTIKIFCTRIIYGQKTCIRHIL